MELRDIIVFLLGFLSCVSIFYGFNYSGVEVPFGTGLVDLETSAVAPSDWITEEDIILFKNRVILEIPNVTISSYANTGSMKPVFDKGANGIRIVPNSIEDIQVGDIVSYRFGKILVVHRVIEKGIDTEGTYFVTKGDNNILSDEKIRFEDIEYLTIGVIW